MADADRARELIDRYLDGQAGPGELRALSELLEKESAVADGLLAAAEIESLVEQHFHDAPCREELQRTLEQLAAPRRRVMWLAAASLLLAVGGAAWWQFSLRGAGNYDVLSGQLLVEGQPTGEIVEGAAMVVGGESPAVIQLTDGSQAQLEPQTEAVMHGRQGMARQVVELLQGSGVFRVARGDRQFRVDTSVGSVTALGTEFSVDVLQSNREGEEDMRSVRTGIAALVVSVAAGIVQVDIQSKSFVLSTGESRVFAAAQNDGREKKPAPPPLPPGDLLGFAINGKSVALERTFPGITAALMLTEEQKRQIRTAQEETVQSESVRAAGVKIKSEPDAKAEEKAKAQEVISAARKELQEKVDAIVTAEQKSLVKQLNAAATEAQKTVTESFRKDLDAAKGDKAKDADVWQRMREPLATEFKSLAAKFLAETQIAAMDQASAAQKAAEERAKNDPKKSKKP